MNKLWKEIQLQADQVSDLIVAKLVAKYIKPSKNLSAVFVKLLATKLADEDLSQEDLSPLFQKVIADILQDIEQDLIACYKRDFACKTHLEVVLLYRGFHVLIGYRLSHELWKQNELLNAKWINKRISELYGVDIHPAAKLGHGIVIDHCMGIVIGETCRLGNHVFLFHNVTLGGTGHASGDRHPKVQSNVVIGAGATLLGNITIGDYAVIAAGSVVLNNVAPHTIVAGVPAKAKGQSKKIQ